MSTFFKINVENLQNVINLHGAESIDSRHKLAVVIRWFAGGSYLDIRLVHCMGRSTIYSCVWHTVDAINAAPELQLVFPWDDDEKLNELEQGFASLSGGRVRGCVFVMDGFAVRIKAPVGVNNPRDTIITGRECTPSWFKRSLIPIKNFCQLHFKPLGQRTMPLRSG